MASDNDFEKQIPRPPPAEDIVPTAAELGLPPAVEPSFYPQPNPDISDEALQTADAQLARPQAPTQRPMDFSGLPDDSIDFSSKNSYDETVSSLTEQPTDELQRSLYSVRDAQPEQYAKDLELANKLGIGVEQVAADRDRLQMEAEFMDNEYFQSLQREAPELAGAFINDPDFAALAKDDIESLKGITGFFRATGRAYKAQSTQIDKAIEIGGRVMWSGDDITDEELNALEQARMDAIPNDYGFDGLLGNIWLSTVEQIPVQLETLGQGLEVGGPGAAVGLVGGGLAGLGVGAVLPTVGEEPATIASGARTGAKILGRGGFTLGSFKAAAEMESGFALEEFALMRDENGDRMDPAAARQAARFVGYVNGGMEFLGYATILKNVPILNKALPGATEETLKAAMKQKIKTALRDKVTRDALTAFGKKYAQGITVETATEMMQELSTILFREVAQADSGQEFEDDGGFSAGAERVFEAGKEAAAATVLLNAPGPSVSLGADLHRIKRAQADKAKIEELQGLVEQSNTAKRAPDKLELLIGKAKENGDVQDAHIPVEAFVEYFQKQGLDPSQVAEELGITEQFKTAQESGGAVAIPVETYTSKLVASGQHQGLINDTKFDPDGYTVNEATQAQKEFEGRVEQETERVRADLEAEDGARTVRTQIYGDVLEKLVEAGIPENQARPQAELIAGRYSATAERAGIDALEFYQQSGIAKGIRRSLPQSLASSTMQRIRGLIDRIQGKQVEEAATADQRVSDAQAVQDLQRFADSLGIDAQTTDPDEIIKAIEQYGNFIPEDEEVLNQKTEAVAGTEVSPLGYYSKMARVLAQKLNPKGTPEQYQQQARAFANKGEFKPDELEWSGLEDWLMMQHLEGVETLDRQQVLDFLNGHGFKLIEVGEVDDPNALVDNITSDDFYERDHFLEEADPSYIEELARDHYEDEARAELIENLEEGEPEPTDRDVMERAIEMAEESYRDNDYNYVTVYGLRAENVDYDIDVEVRNGGDTFAVLIEGNYIDEGTDWPQAVGIVTDWLRDKGVVVGEGPQHEEWTGDGGENYSFFRLLVPELKGGTYRQRSHYPEDNVVLHYRTKDRRYWPDNDTPGTKARKVLFIEEIQSDLHQAAYKAKLKDGIGYLTELDQSKIEAELQATAEAGLVLKAARKAKEKELEVLSDEIFQDWGDLSGVFAQDMATRFPYVLEWIDRKGESVEDLKARRYELVVAEAQSKSNEILAPWRSSFPTGLSIREMHLFQDHLIRTLNRAHAAQKKLDYRTEMEAYFKEVIDNWKGVKEFYETEHPSGRASGTDTADYQRAVNGYKDNMALYEWLKEQPDARFVDGTEKAEYLIDKALEKLDRYRELEDAYKIAAEKYRDAQHAQTQTQGLVPYAPFGKTWRSVAMKRLLLRAVQGGYDAIGWTTGAQQNVRYGLSRFMDDAVGFKDGDNYVLNPGDYRVSDALIQAGAVPRPNNSNAVQMTSEQLDEILGVQNANLVREQVEDLDPETSTTIDFTVPIEIGGEKKGGLYDGMLPQEFAKLMKKLDKGAAKPDLIDYDMVENGRQIGKIWYAPLTDEAKKNIGHGLELFQRNPDKVQGAYNPATKIITLFEGADLSTLLHELGHLWLDEQRALAGREDVSAEFKADYEKLKQWLGVEGDAPFTVEQHEQFARSFEAYLMEGKAPSNDLQSAFDTFAAWMRWVYKTMQNLAAAAGFRVQMNEDIRGIFDKMLATDEEINERMATAEFLEDPTVMEMMTAQEKTAYVRKKQQARDRAKAELMGAAVKDVTKKRNALWKEEAANVRRDVTEAMKSDPVYQAISALTNGHFIGDEQNEKGLPRIKISRDWFLETYGVQPTVEVQQSESGKSWFVLKNGIKEGTFKSQEKAEEAAKIKRERSRKQLPADLPAHVKRAIKLGGVHPDEAANLLAPGAFQSGRAMVEALMTAKPVKDFIEEQTQRIMDERHPDLLDEASITEEALKALHNEMQAESLALEYEAINKRANHQPFTKDMAKAVAMRLLNKQKIRDLRGTYHYYRSGIKLARQVGEAVKGKDFEKAADLKRKQMINHYLYRMTKDNEAKVDSGLKYLRKFQRKGVRAKIEIEYLDQIDEMLEGYDLRKSSSRKVRDKRESLRDFMERMAEQGTPVDIPETVIADSFRTSYKDMSIPDFLAMRASIENIEHLGRLKQKLLKAADQRAFEAVVSEMLEKIEESNPELAEEPMAPRLRDKMKGSLAKWHSEHWKPEFIFRFLDGSEELGPVWRALFEPLAIAENEENLLMAEYIRRLREIYKDYRPLGMEKGLLKPDRVFIEEIGQALTKDQIIAVALNWGNEYNREALMEGEKWQPEQVEAILDLLTKEDWDIVTQTWGLIDSLWPRIAAMEKRLTGQVPEKVEPAPVSTKFGVFSGGYYPIAFDRSKNEKAFKRAQKGDATAVFQNNFTKPATKNGHVKERKGTGGQRLLLDTNVVGEHLYQVIHDLTHREAAIDVYRLLTEDRIQKAIISRAGRQAYRVLLPWLQRVVNERKIMETELVRGFTKIRANATLVTMGLKVTTAIQQPLGILTTAEAIGTRWTGHGLKAFYGMDDRNNPLANMKAQVEKVNELSPFMAERSENFDRDVRQAVDRMTRDNPFVEDWRLSMFYLTQMTQKGVDYPTWLGAYAQGMNELFDGDENKAVAYADSVVRRTQSAGGAKDLAQVQAHGEVARWFTMFYSYFSVLYNVVAERAVEAKRGERTIPQLVASAIYLWFLPAVLGALMTGQGPDDDENYAAWAAKQTLLMPFSMVVGVRDVASALFSGYDYRMTPIQSAVETIVQGFRAGFKGAAEGEISEYGQKQILYTAGYLTGLPTAQAWNMLDYLRDYVNGEKEGFSLYEFLVKKNDK